MHHSAERRLIAGRNYNLIVGYWMQKAQLSSMQQEIIVRKSVKKKAVLLVATMRTIAYNRMENMGKMPADLVHSSGFRGDFDE